VSCRWPVTTPRPLATRTTAWTPPCFLRDVDAIDVHMLISAYCFFRMSNRHTFGAILGLDMLDPARRDRYRQLIGDLIVSYLTTPAG
jgi:Tetracyclin repressor-like, C-terminal domain